MTDKLTFVLDVLLSLVGLAGILYMFVRALKNSENRVGLIIRWVITLVMCTLGFALAIKIGPYGPFIIAVMGILLSAMWTPAISEFIIQPLTGIFDGGSEPQTPKPLYSMAMSKRQRGKFLEATLAIREQLDKFPNDMEGIMLLSKIQAEDMKDLASAEMTLNRFFADPKSPPKQCAAVMTQLADWHLQLAQDTSSAQMALEKIIAKYPDTELSLAAEQRIAHLGGAEKILLAKHDPRVIAVPEGVHNVGLLESSEFLRPVEEDPAKLAGVYVKHLEQHPHDTDIREKLAVVYADHYKRLDLAVGELAQMINMPGQPPKKVAHWLTLLANLQIRHGADYDTVRQTLEKIVTAFPNLPVAQSAQNRIAHLKLEIKGLKDETSGVKLGDYEQNIGLKYGAPKKY